MTFRQFNDRRARADYATLFEDFLSLRTGEWTITTVEAGTGDATEVAGGRGGILTVTNDNANGDRDAFQWAGGGGATVTNVRFVPGKKTQFVARFALADADATAFLAGVYVVDTEPVGGVTDGVYFRVASGNPALLFVVEKNGVESVVPTGATLADGEFVSVEFYYNGQDLLVYVNEQRVLKAPLDNLPDDENLALSFVVQNGAAAAKSAQIDYIGVAQER